MISIYQIKPKFQQFLKPALTALHKMGVSANQITLASLVLSLFIGMAFWFAADYPILFLALPIGLFLRMALNALDGMMARTYNQQSKEGEVLNEIGDIFSDLFVFFPLIRFEQDHIYLIVVFICLSIINEFAGLLGKVIKGERRYDGPMGKSDRAFVLGLYGIFSFLRIGFKSYSVWLFAIVNLLLVISTATRIRKTLSDPEKTHS